MWPAAAANTRLEFVGSTAMRPNAALSGRPMCCQVAPLSVDL